MNNKFVNSLIITLVLSALTFILLPVLSSSISMPLLAAVFVFVAGVIVAYLNITGNNHDSQKSNKPVGDFTTLYVGNLAYKVNEKMVKEHFSQFGAVNSVRLMKDKRTGKRKGYGFVEMEPSKAQGTIEALNETDFFERTLKVRLAKDKQD